jgi:competence protein ComGC
MHAFLKDSRRAGSDRRQTAFALKELVAVIGVLTLLFCVQLSAMIGSNNQARVAQCAANLKQIAAAAINFANDNNGNLPTIGAPGGGGSWAWDISDTTITALTNEGAIRQSFYCPACPEQNADGLWNYDAPSFRVIGYVLAFSGNPELSVTNEVTALFPGRTRAGTIVPASQQVMVADVTMSLIGVNATQAAAYQYTGIQGGYTAPGWHGHRTAHLANNLPAGGNLVMTDGHVEWRTFTNMVPRTSQVSPAFWW